MCVLFITIKCLFSFFKIMCLLILFHFYLIESAFHTVYYCVVFLSAIFLMIYLIYLQFYQMFSLSYCLFLPVSFSLYPAFSSNSRGFPSFFQFLSLHRSVCLLCMCVSLSVCAKLSPPCQGSGSSWFSSMSVSP